MSGVEETDADPVLGMIWAQDRAGGIGSDGDLPWHLPEDMAHFRLSTRGAPVIMGRLQWESLPPRFQPLPGRENIVLTRDRSYAAAGAHVCHDLAEAIRIVAGRRAWVIGGGQIYAQAMEFADELVVTMIDDVFDTDVSAPIIDLRWREVERTPATGWTTGANGLRFAISRYHRS